MRPIREGSAPPVRSEEVPSDFMCAICFGVPLLPTLTRCEHLFCEGCIKRALESMPSCPNCRTNCNQGQIRGLAQGTLPHRVWGGIIVKCPKHNSGCGWTGLAIDAVDHIEICEAGHGRNGHSGTCSECDTTQEENRQLAQKITELEERLAQRDHALRTLRKDGRLELPVLFTGQYHYRRENVVELSQLISRYLENKPNDIDSNRIYNCVKSCYTDLKANYNDNPKYYYEDMRMLLTTCHATAGWFSDKQMDNIQGWLKERGWN